MVHPPVVERAGRWITATAIVLLAAGDIAVAQPASPVRGLAFRGDTQLVSASDNAVEIWDLGAKRFVQRVDIDPVRFQVFDLPGSSALGHGWSAAALRQSARVVPAGRFGAGAYYPGGAIRAPVPVKHKVPHYTTAAMRKKIQGTVRLEMIVNADGTPGEIRVVQSLDRRHGLDDEAVAAARGWRFKPGRDAEGIPVPVLIEIELEFRLG